jgi:hypothetical protein
VCDDEEDLMRLHTSYHGSSSACSCKSRLRMEPASKLQRRLFETMHI